MADPATDPFPTSTDTASSYFSTPPDTSNKPDILRGDNVIDLFPVKTDPQKAATELASLQGEKVKQEDLMLGEFNKKQELYQTRMKQMIAAEGATIDEVKRGSWNSKQELEKRETSLWEQFGSPGFLIAMMGSAFSAQPMNSALMAGGAAMSALNKGKMDDYQRAFDAWRQNTDLVIKRQQMEHQEYEDIAHLASTDMQAWGDKFRAISTRFDDKRKQALYENGMIGELFDSMDAETKAKNDLIKYRDLLDEKNRLVQLINAHPEVKKDPIAYQRLLKEYEDPSNLKAKAANEFVRKYQHENNGLSPPPEEIIKFEKEQSLAEHAWSGSLGGGAPTKEKEIARIQAEIKEKAKAAGKEISEADSYKQAAQEVEKAHRTLTANEAGRQAGHLGQYDLALTDLIPQAEDILKRHVGAAGVAGYATRTAESVSNIFGSNDTDRRQFESDIDELRLMAPQLLLDRATGRPLSAEHAYIDHIIRGLNMGDTTANTLRSLEELKQRLAALRENVQKRIGGEASALTSKPAATAPGWDEFPEVK